MTEYRFYLATNAAAGKKLASEDHLGENAGDRVHVTSRWY